MKKFLENLKPLNTFICFTHCDESDIDEEFIRAKLASLKKYGKLEIPEENVILFDKNVKSLKEFVANMVEGEINITNDLEEALDAFDEEMPELAK